MSSAISTPDLELLERIACYWTTRKGIEFSSEDVVAMLTLVSLEMQNVPFIGFCFTGDDLCSFTKPPTIVN